MTDRIQKVRIYLNLVKLPIVHRRTLETLAVLTVPSALSPDDEKPQTTMSTALTRLLSRFGDDGCRLLPCDSPREIRKILVPMIQAVATAAARATCRALSSQRASAAASLRR